MQGSIETPRYVEEPLDLDEGIDLIDLALPVLRAKRKITWITLAALLLGYAIAWCLRPVFTATAVIMPPQQQQSAASALMGQLGSMGGLGAAAGLSIKNPADLYVGILQSRVIADDLIERFKLLQVYDVKLRWDARRLLSKDVEFEAARDGLIYIRVKSHDARQAAALANGYVEELYQTNSRLAIGEAGQRRLFFEQRVQEQRRALTQAEDDLKRTQEQTGMIQLSGQAEMTIRNIATARAEIASREVQLGVTRTFATDQNPEVVRLQQEIASLRGQLGMLENSQQRMVPGDLQMTGGKVAGAGLEYLRKVREVRYHESLLEMLAKQQEAAAIDEAKSAPLIQVVDAAEAPERKSGPSRILIALGCGLTALVLSSLWEMGRSVLEMLRRTPEQAARLDQLQRALRLRQG